MRRTSLTFLALILVTAASFTTGLAFLVTSLGRLLRNGLMGTT